MRYLLVLLVFISTLWSTEPDWSHDYKQALEVAKKENKHIYVLITSANCRWCRKFESTTLQDEQVLERLNQKYILLHIDRNRDYLPAKFKKKRVPKHYFITAKEKIIFSFFGWWDSLDFNSYLDDVDKEYKKKVKSGKLH